MNKTIKSLIIIYIVVDTVETIEYYFEKLFKFNFECVQNCSYKLKE